MDVDLSSPVGGLRKETSISRTHRCCESGFFTVLWICWLVCLGQPFCGLENTKNGSFEQLAAISVQFLLEMSVCFVLMCCWKAVLIPKCILLFVFFHFGSVEGEILKSGSINDEEVEEEGLLEIVRISIFVVKNRWFSCSLFEWFQISEKFRQVNMKDKHHLSSSRESQMIEFYPFIILLRWRMYRERFKINKTLLREN